MKYLFLIIRHLFPRRRWVEVRRQAGWRRAVLGEWTDMSKPNFHLITMRDQFGNLKTFREE